jgi:hypothetical protein
LKDLQALTNSGSVGENFATVEENWSDNRRVKADESGVGERSAGGGQARERHAGCQGFRLAEVQALCELQGLTQLGLSAPGGRD